MSKMLKKLWERLSLTQEDPVVPTQVPQIKDEEGRALAEASYALYRRLHAACRSGEAGFTRITTEQLANDQHILKMLCIMFHISEPEIGLLTNEWIQGSLNANSEINIDRNVFYIYVDKSNTKIRKWDLIEKAFYESLNNLLINKGELWKFVNERWRNSDPANESYDPENKIHKGNLMLVVPYHVSVHKKDFPAGAKDDIFIVGRRALHDKAEIQRIADKLASESARFSRSEYSFTDVKVAATVKAAGSYKGKAVVFNAHSYLPAQGSTRHERMLYIGNWSEDWDLSIGSAEHDEIQCKALGDVFGKIELSNLKFDLGKWDYEYHGPSNFPDWFKCINTVKSTKVPRDNVRVYIHKYGAITTPLIKLLERQEYRPQVSLVARALPWHMHSIPEFEQMTNRSFSSHLASLSIASAIEIQQDRLWLVRTKDDFIYYIADEKGDKVWRSERIGNNVQFGVGDYHYAWARSDDDLVPSLFCGQLRINAPDNLKSDFFSELVVADIDAEPLHLVHDLFTDQLHRDIWLGDKGIISFQSAPSKDGRPTYRLLAVQYPRPQNPVFAFRSAVNDDRASASWLIYDKEDPNRNNLKVVKRGNYGEIFILKTNEPLHISGANNTLICGTSVFLVKTSTTPKIDLRRPHSPGRAAARVEKQTREEAEGEAGNFDPVILEDVKFRLMKTEWALATLIYIDSSNVAVHYVMTGEGKDDLFLKVYFPKSAMSAEREANFYRKYNNRAGKLFLKTPKELAQDRPNLPPWALLFPRLTPIDELLQRPTLSQTSAIGYGLAVLLNAMAEDGLINYDIDPSMLCLDQSGKLVVVDFDNVYPIVGENAEPSELEPLRGIWDTGILPAKSIALPPEAMTFKSKKTDDERIEALKRIGSAYNTYMIALIMLELLKFQADGGGSHISIPEGAFSGRAKEQEMDTAAVAQLEGLLGKMLEPQPAKRPNLPEVISEMSAILRSFAHNDEAKKEIERLIHKVP